MSVGAGRKRPFRLGWVAALGGVVGALTLVGNGVFFGLFIAGDKPSRALLETSARVGLAFNALMLGLSALVLIRSLHAAPGATGRGRMTWLSLSSAALSIAWGLSFSFMTDSALFSLGLDRALRSIFSKSGAPILVPDLFVVAPSLVAGALSLPALVALLACFWLIPKHIRARIWVGIDALLLAAVGLMTIAFPIPLTPRAGDSVGVALAAFRLGITAVAVVRMIFRFLPALLDAIERTGFQALIAARLLRAGKSRFLTTIGALAVLAVTFSSCALSTTLSVMGGFREDLKKKILGNNAHIVIDRDRGTWEGWEAPLAQIRRAEGVRGASPYVTGEVMISSTSNLAGAVLRGIDLDHIREVADLPNNIRRGDLEDLAHPERANDLSSEDPSRGMPTRARPPEGDASRQGSVLRDVDDMLGPGRAPRDRSDPIREDLRPFLLDEDLLLDRPTTRSRAPSPPGIVVGQELARSLRLFVGDDVNVVAPFGGIGPSGPIPKSRTFRVVAIFYSGMYEHDMKTAYVTLTEAQGFLSVGRAIHGIEVKVEDIDAAPRVATTLRTSIDRRGLRVRDWQELNRNLFGALALEKLAMFIALGIAIVVAGFCVFGTLTLMVQEKAREVAVLKAMGTAARGIVSVFLLEGLFIGLFGALLGLGLGFIACFAAEHFGVSMNPEVYYIDRLPIHVDPLEFTLVGVASVMVCVAATIFPATFASRLEPVDALRYE